MHFPQVVVFEQGERFSRMIRYASEAHGASGAEQRLRAIVSKNRTTAFRLLECRRTDRCLRYLRRSETSVLVLVLDGDAVEPPTDRLALLDRVRWQLPEVSVVVIDPRGDSASAGLSWSLGAHYVWSPPQPPDLIPAVIEGLLSPVEPSHGQRPAHSHDEHD